MDAVMFTAHSNAQTIQYIKVLSELGLLALSINQKFPKCFRNTVTTFYIRKARHTVPPPFLSNLNIST